jgi:hypothetical protein
MKNANQAIKAQRGAGIDIWESRYVCGGRSMKRDGKRTAKRAQRRLNKALISEQRAG